jgi:hypothetical protein
MSTRIDGDGVVFGDGSVLRTDPLRVMTERLSLPRNTGTDYGGTINDPVLFSFHSYLWDRNQRSQYRNDLFRYHPAGGDPDNPVSATWSAVSQRLSVLVENFSASVLKVNVESGVWDMTDDASAWRVYVGGTAEPASISGGVLHYDSGYAGRTGNWNGAARNAVTTTLDIAPSSGVWLHQYTAMGPGSGSDALRGFMNVTFNSWA